MMKISDEPRLKLLAEHWLDREKGVKGIDTEVEYDAGVADVVSNDQRWFIECGGSRSSKILDFFRKSNEKAFIVFFKKVGITSFRAAPS